MLLSKPTSFRDSNIDIANTELLYGIVDDGFIDSICVITTNHNQTIIIIHGWLLTIHDVDLYGSRRTVRGYAVVAVACGILWWYLYMDLIRCIDIVQHVYCQIRVIFNCRDIVDTVRCKFTIPHHHSITSSQFIYIVNYMIFVLPL